ncbi:unnamed protein product [Amoebophrya sp. A25]|nr:unnamed protein product [Amoebophrya sp. A25]|eukprot:GSA25T00011513001.1
MILGCVSSGPLRVTSARSFSDRLLRVRRAEQFISAPSSKMCCRTISSTSSGGSSGSSWSSFSSQKKPGENATGASMEADTTYYSYSKSSTLRPNDKFKRVHGAFARNAYKRMPTPMDFPVAVERIVFLQSPNYGNKIAATQAVVTTSTRSTATSATSRGGATSSSSSSSSNNPRKGSFGKNSSASSTRPSDDRRRSSSRAAPTSNALAASDVNMPPPEVAGASEKSTGTTSTSRGRTSPSAATTTPSDAEGSSDAPQLQEGAEGDESGDHSLEHERVLMTHKKCWRLLQKYKEMKASEGTNEQVILQDGREVFRLRRRKTKRSFVFVSNLSDEEVAGRLQFNKRLADLFHRKRNTKNCRAWGHYATRDHDCVVREYEDYEDGEKAAGSLRKQSREERASVPSSSALGGGRKLVSSGGPRTPDIYRLGGSTFRLSSRGGKPSKIVFKKQRERPPKMPPVLIDDREHKLAELADRLGVIPFEKKRLQVADIVIGEPGREVFLERKSVSDFWSSITDARLHNQLGNKLALTQGNKMGSAAIILEGFSAAAIDHSRRLRSKKRLLYGKLVNLVLRDRIPVLMSQDVAETYQLVVVIAENYYEALSGQSPRDYASDWIHGRKKGSSLEMMISMVPGVSERVASKILEKFVEDHVELTGVNSGDDHGDKDKKTALTITTSASGTTSTSTSCNATASLSAAPVQDTQSPADVGTQNEKEAASSPPPACHSDRPRGPVNMLDFCQRLRSDVAALEKLTDCGLKMPTAKTLVCALAGPDALSLRRERLVEKLRNVPGASGSTVKQVVGNSHSASQLLQKLQADPQFFAKVFKFAGARNKFESAVTNAASVEEEQEATQIQKKGGS